MCCAALLQWLHCSTCNAPSSALPVRSATPPACNARCSALLLTASLSTAGSMETTALVSTAQWSCGCAGSTGCWGPLSCSCCDINSLGDNCALHLHGALSSRFMLNRCRSLNLNIQLQAAHSMLACCRQACTILAAVQAHRQGAARCPVPCASMTWVLCACTITTSMFFEGYLKPATVCSLLLYSLHAVQK